MLRGALRGRSEGVRGPGVTGTGRQPTVQDEIIVKFLISNKSLFLPGPCPIVSFGGQSGTELAASCSSLSQLTAAYQPVISTLHVTDIDFDIEGAEIAYPADNALRFLAINALEAQPRPGRVGHHPGAATRAR